jgi:Bacterial aa3 type cytochrome c oxidase subunit IV
MAEHGEPTTYETATGNDYEQHEATYLHFIQLLKWSAIGCVIVLALMAFFLT